jgi:O-antigen/teichoic acid export membrane protein
MKTSGLQIAKNSFSRVLTFFVVGTVTLLVTPVIIHSLGDRHYGIWVIAGSFMGFYELFDLGISTALSRYVSMYVTKKDSQNVNKVFNSTLVIFIAMGFIIIACSIIIGLNVQHFFHVEVEEGKLLRSVILIMGIAFSIKVINKVFEGVLAASMRYDIISIIKITTTLLWAGISITLLKAGGGLLALSYLILILDIVLGITSLLLTFKERPELGLDFRLVNKFQLRQVFSFSGITFLIMIAKKIRLNAPPLIIGSLYSVSAVTYFSIAYRLIEYFMNFAIAFGGATTPVYSSHETQGDYQAIRKLFIPTTKHTAMLSLFIGTMIMVFGKVFIVTWVGEKYISAYPVLVVLVIPTMIDLAQLPITNAMFGMERHKYLALFSIGETIFNILLTILFIKFFELGILGAAFGAAIPMLIIKTFVQPFYGCRMVGLSVREYFQNALLFPIVVNLVCGGLMFIELELSNPGGYLSLASWNILNSLFLLASGYFLVLDTKERGRYLTWAGQLLLKMRSVKVTRENI